MDRLDEAEHSLQQSIELAEHGDYDTVRLVSMSNLGMVYFGRKDLDGARASREATLALAEELGNRAVEAATHQNLGIVGLPLGDYDYCRRHLVATIRIGRELGMQETVVSGLSGLGETEFLDANYTEALDAGYEALAIAEDIEAGWWIAFQQRSVADTLITLNRTEEAVSLMRDSVVRFRGLGSTPHLLDSVAGLARALMASDDPEGAAIVAEEPARHIFDGEDISGAAYPLRIHATCLDVFEGNGDPRYREMITAATDALYGLYPDGGHLPWHDGIRNHAKTGSKPRP
jgi:hypothetical protein